jgi:lipopolysaccharide biosynthesis regulator YciM
MEKHMSGQTIVHDRLRWAIAVALLAGWGGSAPAQVAGEIATTQGRTIKGNIRWQPSSKVYGVVQANNVELKVPLADAAKVTVASPQNVAAAIKIVQSGQQVERAIPVLETVMADYQMLQWDVVAARWLADAHLQKGDAKKAIEMCEAVIAQNADAGVTGDLPQIYWRALLADGRTAKLKEALTDGIKRGDRQTMALAQILRGDIAMKEGEFKDALIDGYLRTVCLFREVKALQPEALYKAAQCFEKLSQPSHMEKMRKKLLDDYPNDPYTQKIKSGAGA